LRTKRFHVVYAGNAHECLLKLYIGKVRGVREDIANVNGRLDRIKHLLLEEQKRKIEHLETRMKKLEDALAV
jgi:hypothetical protein